MTIRRPALRIPEGKEIPISILELWSRDEMLWIPSLAVPQENFPPCIKNIILCRSAEGKHRAAAILAAFLGQVGWGISESRRLWQSVAGVEDRIFDEWFGMMHCPKCKTLKKRDESYPDLGIGDLGFCQPDKKCPEFQGPVEYAAEVRCENDRSKGWQKRIKTIHLARVFNWISGKEGEIELSQTEKEELQGLLAKQTENEILSYTRAKVRGRLRPRFTLKETDSPRKRVLSELL